MTPHRTPVWPMLVALVATFHAGGLYFQPGWGVGQTVSLLVFVAACAWAASR